MRKGFTVTELIVVVAIIVLLSGLVIPALLKSVRAAQAAHCMANMRQLGVATLHFAHDNDLRFPRSQHSAFAHGELVWARALAPYLGSSARTWRELLATTYRCAGDRRAEQLSYGLNVYFELGPYDDYAGYPQTWRRLSHVSSPANTILFAENNSAADHLMPNFWSSPAHVADCAHDRHEGGANYAFVDGHVEFLKLEAIYDPATGVDAWHPAPR